MAHRTRVATVFVLAALAAASGGCLRDKIQRPPADPGAPAVEAVEPPAVPLDTATPPTQIELIMEEGRAAEAEGDLERAIGIYEGASSGKLGQDDTASLQYHLALLYLDPSFEWQRIEESRSILQDLLAMSPPFSRRTEARLVLWLLEEIERMQTEAAGLESRADTLATEVESLKARLTEKEQELERIKQVLLREEP